MTVIKRRVCDVLQTADKPHRW